MMLEVATGMCQANKAYDTSTDRLLHSTAEPGVYVLSGRFRAVVDALQRGFFALRGVDEAFRHHSSGFLPRGDLARSSYLEKFPQFVARVTSEVDADATGQLVTLPSACLSLYPVISQDGAIPSNGRLATIASPCFRNEVGYGPERMRSFHMAEYVFFGDGAQTRSFRDDMLARVEAWLAELGLFGRVANASDPFFGRMGEILAERQRSANLKLEMLVKVGPEREVAAFSFNDHKEFFCTRWDIVLAAGGQAESSCVGVGLERLALAMFHQHGALMDSWPQAFRSTV